MSCFVFVVLAGGLGFLSFFGGLFWLVRRVFSGFWGFLRFSLFCSCLLGWVAGCGGFRGSGSARPGVLLPSCWGGRVWGASARARFLSCPVLAVVGVGGRGRVCVLSGFPLCGGGRVVPGFLFVFAVFLLVFAGGFRVLFFPSGASRVLLVSGVGLRGLAGGWGVVGGVGLGSGLFFLRLLLYWPGLVSGFLLWGAGLGLGWVLFGEFDPGSGRTLAACLTHASRTGPPSFLGVG